MPYSDELKSTYLKVGMLSPARILEISSGEVSSAETLNYRHLHPSSSGLFSEKIFGPIKDWECRCGKYRKGDNKGGVCEICGVSITSSRVRRERFGHIELGCNVVLPPYLYGNPSILATVLDIPQNYLTQVVFGNLPINVDEYWSFENKLSAIDNQKDSENDCLTGTDAILAVLETIDLYYEIQKTQERIDNSTGYISLSYKHRKEVLEQFYSNENKPEWMITSKLLVIPPEMRPIVEYKGRILASQINDRYRNVIVRSNRLKQLKKMSCPEIIIKAEYRLLQTAIDYLFTNELTRENNDNKNIESLIHKYKSRVDRIVDFSAKGMALPDQSIDIEQIGIPMEVAAQIFKPFIARILMKSGVCQNIKSSYKQIEAGSYVVGKYLSRAESSLVVLVSTSSGRLISFKATIIQDNCFRLNPIVYEMLDLGVSDQDMIISCFAQLSNMSAKEAYEKLGVRNQIISKYTDKLQLLPSQYAINWIAQMSKTASSQGKKFANKGEVYCAYENGYIGINELLEISCNTGQGFQYSEETTVGRLIINEFLPQDMGVINRSSLRNKYMIEYNEEIHEDEVIDICESIYSLKGTDRYLLFLREFERVLYRYSNAVHVNYEKNRKQTYFSSIKKDFVEMMGKGRNRLRSFRLSDSEYETEKINIKYSTACMRDYIDDYLLNRRVAGDVYDFADRIIADGEIITKSTLKSIHDRKIESINIYMGSIDKDGNYSEYAFGRPVDYNPFVTAIMAINDTLRFLPSSYGRAVVYICLFDGVTYDPTITEIVNEFEKEGEIGKCIERMYDKEHEQLVSVGLIKSEVITAKSFLIYYILKKYGLSISIRSLNLLMEAIIAAGEINSLEGEIANKGQNVSLPLIGECGVKSLKIDLGKTSIPFRFGISPGEDGSKSALFGEESIVADKEDIIVDKSPILFDYDTEED